MDELVGLSENLVIYLVASILAVPVLKRLGLGTAPGYLLAGMVIGPWGLSLVREAGHINSFSNFTVLAFLFLLGLELDPKRINRDFNVILKLGSMQLLLTSSVFIIITMLFGRTWFEALAVALALSVSTSTLVSPLLADKTLYHSDAGHAGLAILQFHALALIPLLILIPLLGLGSPLEEADGVWSVFKALFLLALMGVVGRYVIRYLLRYIVSIRLPEIFIAFILLVIFSTTLFMHGFGLSLGLGALICGVLLADSEFSLEIKSDIEPFRGLLVGLFFISIGMAVDFGLLLQRPAEILGLLLVLLLVKAAAFYIIAAITELPFLQRPRFSLLLSQGGELTFVLLVLGAGEHAIASKLSAMLTVVVVMSMLLTPLLLMTFRRTLLAAEVQHQDSLAAIAQEERPQVIVAGFGRFGQIVSRLLVSAAVRVIVIDHDPLHLESAHKLGYDTRYGNALRPGLLQSVGANSASVLVIALDEREQALVLLETVKKRFPKLRVVARAWDMPHQWQLMRMGVESVQRETYGSAVMLGEDVLSLLGEGIDEVERYSEAFRDHDERLLNTLYQAWSGASQQRVSSRGRDELTQVMKGDINKAALERKLVEEEDKYG